ncbi:hypothetical protein [Streptomyces rishiriensis]|uniref:DNA-binding protein n=1 Tax=Streptomyces rishiriensis TaxID=68264 RepID=A0ABU0NFK9_STRRH|nr:hypothetical protein [Streptomyces rishiriensis]MDQ0577877.1 hypothetical protein [Streptomyces rishiriensis]
MPHETAVQLGERLQKILRESGKTQVGFADYCKGPDGKRKYSTATISRYFHGDRIAEREFIDDLVTYVSESDGNSSMLADRLHELRYAACRNGNEQQRLEVALMRFSELQKRPPELDPDAVKAALAMEASPELAALVLSEIPLEAAVEILQGVDSLTAAHILGIIWYFNEERRGAIWGEMTPAARNRIELEQRRAARRGVQLSEMRERQESVEHRLSRIEENFSGDVRRPDTSQDPAPGEPVLIARALHFSAPLMGLPEDQMFDLVELAALLEQDAVVESPDPARLKRWSEAIIAVLSACEAGGALRELLISCARRIANNG